MWKGKSLPRSFFGHQSVLAILFLFKQSLQDYVTMYAQKIKKERDFTSFSFSTYSYTKYSAYTTSCENIILTCLSAYSYKQVLGAANKMWSYQWMRWWA